MEIMTKAAWAALALLHLMPALPLVRPSLIERLYGVPPEGDLGVLLIHRAALFGVVLIAACVSIVHVDSRKFASFLVAISMISFLVLYVRAGAPAGDLRKVAIADAVGLVPLGIVVWRAWL